MDMHVVAEVYCMIVSISTHKQNNSSKNESLHVNCRTLGAPRPYNAHVSYPQENGRLYSCTAFNGGSTGSLQRNGFGEKTTNFLTFVVC